MHFVHLSEIISIGKSFIRVIINYLSYNIPLSFYKNLVRIFNDKAFSSPWLKKILVNCSTFAFLLNFSFMK